jgi:hypothetical protein
LNWTAGRGLDLVSEEEPSRHRTGETGFYPTGAKANAEYRYDAMSYVRALFIDTGAAYSANRLANFAPAANQRAYPINKLTIQTKPPACSVSVASLPALGLHLYCRPTMTVVQRAHGMIEV